MDEPVVHAETQRQLDKLVRAVPHAVMLVGPTGIGKGLLARRLAAASLSVSRPDLDNYAYKMFIAPEGRSISIDAVRELEHFLALKVPSAHSPNRVVIIEDGHLMTPEAQNALLKTLEEPPAGTLIIVTVGHVQSVLPTVRSRTQDVQIQRPSREVLTGYFSAAGRTPQEIDRAYMLSGGMPGLMAALLEGDEHPLLAATDQARQLLTAPLPQRLTAIDALAKDKQLAVATMDVLQRMAHLSLQTAQGAQSQKWQRVLRASYETAEALDANAQPKLALTNLVLQF